MLVALCRQRCAPPLGPGEISTGIGAELGQADRVEFRDHGGVRMGKYDAVWLGLDAKGVVVHFGRGEDHSV